MATQLANAYVQIIPSAEGIKGKIARALGAEASEAGEKAGVIAGNSLGDTLNKVVGAAGIGAAAIGTALGALTKQAVASYADYEQLVGGVETLFEDLSYDVIENSQKAFMTAGLSANEYMETVMGFSASLNQSLLKSEKNIARAADVADQIIIDMSDNANKMGTSMESIQNAYAGFSKQNYTMLDNLKLGYGGTKSEMERLLQDAGKLAGTKFDINSFADIAEAIHVVQTEMGITGTTAKEAASTIQGSFGMLKGAWSNFLTGMADPEQDFSLLLNNVIDSVVTVTDNLAPRLVATIPRLVEGLVTLTKNLIPHIGPILEELLPTLIQGTADLAVLLVQNLPSILSTVGGTLLSSLKTILSEIWEKLSDSTKEDLTKLADAFYPLWDLFKSIWEGVGKPVFQEIKGVVANVRNWFVEHFDDICAGIRNVCTILRDQWEKNGKPIFDVVRGVVQGTIEIIVDIWNNIGKPLIDKIVELVIFTKDMFEVNWGSIGEITENLFTGIAEFWEKHLKPCLDAIVNFIRTIVAPAFEFAFKYIILPLVMAVFEKIGEYWEYILKPIFTGIIDFVKNVFSGNWREAFEGIVDTVRTLLSGIDALFREPLELAQKVVEIAIEKIKGLFKFEWSLPQLKLPHFSVSGGEAPWGFGGKGKLPSIGVDWYAKAMNSPMIMTSPTAFGINSLGQVMAGGEKGSEVVSGTDTLMKLIAAAVASQNSSMAEIMDEGFDKVIALLRYLPSLANMRIVTDTGTLIGELAPGMDEALGRLAEE